MSGWGSPFNLAAGALSSIWSFNAPIRSVGVQSTRPQRNSTDTECIICRSDSTEVEFSTSSPTSVCTHPPRVCVSCLQQVILTATTTGDFISGILCPHLGCPQRLDYHDVQKWATSEVFDRYDRLLLQNSLRGDEHYVLCLEPSCATGQEHAGGETNNIVTCHHCGTKQCFRHQVLWHEGLTCEQWDEHQRAITNQQESMTDEWIQTGTKACPGPGCGRRIQKSEGCDHMKCKRPGGCGHQFCWECLAPWLQIIAEDNSRHYDHCVYYSGLPGDNPAPAEHVATPRSHERPRREIPDQVQNLILVAPVPSITPPERFHHLDEQLDEMFREFARLEVLEENRNPQLATFPDGGLRNHPLRPLRLVEERAANTGSPIALARVILTQARHQPERDIPPPAYRPSGAEMPSMRLRVAPSQVAGPGPRTQPLRNNMARHLRWGNPTGNVDTSNAESTRTDNQSEQPHINLIHNRIGGVAGTPPRLQILTTSTYVPPHRRGSWEHMPPRSHEPASVHISRNIGNLVSNTPPREAHLPPHLLDRTAFPSTGLPRVPNTRAQVTAYIPPHLREPPQPAATQISPRW